ncbi:MAG: hypothetical protein ABII82_03310 [Verrucomicrobiota bacterium]
MLVTITLLAFLVLLLVSLATLTRVETTVAQNGQQLDRARQNALFALQLALGRLQQTAGPDQAVTARADIIAASPEAAHWTGVWRAYNPAAADQHLDQDSNLRAWSLGEDGPAWLVSSRPGVNPDPIDYAPEANDSAVMARGIGGGMVNVFVPLVPITATVPGVPGEPVVGRFAYWVSDEGVKAKVNLVDPTFGQNDAALSQLHFASPHALPLQRIFDLEDAGDDYRDGPSAELAKVFGPQALPLLSTVPADVDIKLHGPDLTAHSLGVLANVRHGGLKRDLTAAFEDTAQFDQLTADHGYGDRALYRANAAAGLVPAASVVDMGQMNGAAAGFPNPDGPLWHSLFYHYNAYKPVMTTPAGLGSSATPPTSSVSIGAPPYVLRPRSYRIDYPNTSVPTTLHGIMPMVIAYRVDIALSSYEDAGLWKLRLQYHPQIVLHNPYAARLSVANFKVSKGINAFRFYNLSLSVDGTAVPPFAINQGASGGRYSITVRAGDADTLDPGETRVFALSADVGKANIVEAGNFADLTSVVVTSSTSADHHQYTDVPGFTGIATGDAMVVADLAQTQSHPFVSYREFRLHPASTQWPRSTDTRFQVGATYEVPVPVMPAWTRPISSLETPVRVIGFFTRFKGLQPSANAADYKNGNQSIPLFHGNAGVLSVFEDEHSMQWQEAYLSPAGEPYLSNSTAINTTAGGETAWGDQSVGEGTGANVRRIVLRDVPSLPMVSLGQFMHAPFYRFTDSTAGTSSTSMTFGSMFVGGSIASPIIPTEQVSITADWPGATGKRLHLDDSFLANQVLFDRFFFSTVPPAVLPGNAPAYWTSFNTANTGSRIVDASQPLLNARLKPILRNGELPLLADLRDSRRASAHLLLDGAFNINSTSVPAWRALLSALSGNRLRVWNATDRTVATLDATGAKGRNPIPRFWSASATGQPNDSWDGLRILDDTEINELATRIVEQVRLRGPFLSMGDFLNRRLGPSGPLTRAGALQAAIDNTSPDINAAAKALGVDVDMSGGIPAVIPANLRDATGDPLSTAVGIPGYLMQQDIVQAFSPVMTARSDTFVIRTRGDIVNPATGETDGSAWLEAVVQRTPDFVDQSDPALTALGNATPLYAADGSANVNADNLRFGRRFVVVNFRWLNENDL